MLLIPSCGVRVSFAHLCAWLVFCMFVSVYRAALQDVPVATSAGGIISCGWRRSWRFLTGPPAFACPTLGRCVLIAACGHGMCGPPFAVLVFRYCAYMCPSTIWGPAKATCSYGRGKPAVADEAVRCILAAQSLSLVVTTRGWCMHSSRLEAGRAHELPCFEECLLCLLSDCTLVCILSSTVCPCKGNRLLVVPHPY
jgi:hypothetical protein